MAGQSYQAERLALLSERLQHAAAACLADLGPYISNRVLYCNRGNVSLQRAVRYGLNEVLKAKVVKEHLRKKWYGSLLYKGLVMESRPLYALCNLVWTAAIFVLQV